MTGGLASGGAIRLQTPPSREYTRCSGIWGLEVAPVYHAEAGRTGHAVGAARPGCQREHRHWD